MFNNKENKWLWKQGKKSIFIKDETVMIIHNGWKPPSTTTKNPTFHILKNKTLYNKEIQTLLEI